MLSAIDTMEVVKAVQEFLNRNVFVKVRVVHGCCI